MNQLLFLIDALLPSLSDFVSSLGKKERKKEKSQYHWETHPSKTDFAADSMASDAEA